MFNSQANAYPTPHRQEISQLATWLLRYGRDRRGTFYFLTLSFDRYRSRYLVTGGDNENTPTRAEVKAGLTRSLPPDEIRRAYVADLDRFYKALLRLLFGSRYCRRRSAQPRAVGALDQPVYKGAAKRSLLSRRAGEQFDHAHLVIFVEDAPLPRGGVSANEKFELCYNDGTLQSLWRKTNAKGEVHLKHASDLFGALDYAAKTAKLSAAFHEHMVMWPLA